MTWLEVIIFFYDYFNSLCMASGFEEKMLVGGTMLLLFCRTLPGNLVTHYASNICCVVCKHYSAIGY